MKVRRFASLILLLALVGVPSNGRTQSASEPLDRSVRPMPGPDASYDFPDVQRHSLPNGLRVWLVPRPGVPLVTVRLLLDAGAAAEPAARSGLASMTAAMLREGTRNRTGEQIADELAFLAATLGATAGQESASVSLTTLSRNLEPALALMSDVALDATFPESQWPRVQDQRLVSLLQALDQPTTIATRQFHRQVYGDEHPLGRPVEGTPESVRALTPEMLREFHRTRYRPGAATLIAVGDFTADRMLSLVRKTFGEWQRGDAPPVSAPPLPDRRGPTRVYLLDKPGAAQSEIRIGHVGVPRTHEDYFPLLVMNTILGGQFSSRINLNLREDKGYTYGARSGFEMGRQAGPFVASGGVQTAATRESIVEFLRELTDIRSGRPVTQQEVDFAKASIVRREPLALETNAQIAGRIAELVLYDLPENYYDTYTRHVRAVTVDEVNRVAREHLQPDRAVIVVVGDRATIESAVRELPYPLDVLDTEAAPVR